MESVSRMLRKRVNCGELPDWSSCSPRFWVGVWPALSPVMAVAPYICIETSNEKVAVLIIDDYQREELWEGKRTVRQKLWKENRVRTQADLFTLLVKTRWIGRLSLLIIKAHYSPESVETIKLTANMNSDPEREDDKEATFCSKCNCCPDDILILTCNHNLCLLCSARNLRTQERKQTASSSRQGF